MEDINNAFAPSAEEIEAKAKAEAEAKAIAEAEDPLKKELEKVNKGGRTKKEKLIYTKKRIEEQLRELDTEAGIEPTSEIEDEDTPLTVGMFKKIQQETATKTALQLAEEIEQETERELVKFHLNNTIRSTGNPKEDLKLARAIVNSEKNKQILEQIQQKPNAKKSSSAGGGMPYKEEEPEFTAEELAFMRPPFNLSKEKILKARKEAEKIK